MIKKYCCEVCDGKFFDTKECIEHEQQHAADYFICDKCGKKIIFDIDDFIRFTHKNKCHYIDLGRMGYGSKLDGCDVAFKLCDDCLYDFITTFKNKNKILQTGNYEYN